MNNKKTTKRALLSSVMAIVLCLAMLIGTTFAWFTDSASTAVNKIQAGTLDIELQYQKADSSWESAEGKVLDFKKPSGHENESILWEPGCTYELPAIRILNKGNLALKYKLAITGIKGDAKLNEAIVWTNGATDELLSEYTGTMIPGENDNVTAPIVIKGHMKEEAGNEYRGLSIDGIGITVVATQYTYEYDSNNNTYDAGAEYPVSNSADLVSAIAAAQEGSIVSLTSGTFLLSASQQVGEGVTIAGNGPAATTITTSTTPSGSSKTGLVIDNKNVTIKDTKITGSAAITSNEYCGVLDIREGGTTLDNVVISRSFSNASCVVIKGGVDSGETVTLQNSTFKGGFKTIHMVDGANGTVVIDNCEITGIYTFNVNSASSQDLTVKVTDSKLHGWTSYGRIKEAIFTNTEYSKGSSSYDYLRPYADTTLTDCTFDSSFLMGAGATGFTIRINNCVKDGVAVTAANVQSLLLDAGDMSNLRDCVIIVDGVTATLS